MNAENFGIIVTAAAALLGAGVGGVATIWATSIQQRSARDSEIDREQRAEQRRQEQATKDRSMRAAESCDALFASVSDALRQRPTDAPRGWSDRVSAEAMATVSSESVFLEPGLRQRVDEAALVIRNAEDLIGEAYEISVGWAAHVAFQEVHNATAAWLRGDRLPERSELMCDFILAAERAEEYFDQMYYESVGIEVEAAQRAWRDANAEELTRIRGRGPRSGGY